MKIKLLLVVLVSLTLNAQDLKLTVTEVLSSNPIVLERLQNYNATKEDVTSAESGYYPKLDLSLGVGTEHTAKSALANGTPDQSFDYSVYQNSLKFTQNIFKGFETNARVEQQKNKTLSSAYNYIEKVNDTAFQMVNTYLQVMKNKELLDNAKSNVQINEEILTKVQKLYEAGLTTLSEVNKIESSLALAKSNYVVQENTLLDTTYNMQRILGRYPEIEKMTKPVLHINLPQTKEDATRFAKQNNPSLLVSKYNIQVAQAVYKESRSSFYPSIDLEITQSMSKNLGAVEGENNGFKAMAYLNYNIFNGFADSAALQKSVSQMGQETETKNNILRQVVEGLNLSWIANQKLSEQLQHLNEYKKYSHQTLTLYTREYDLGRRSLLDLLSAQNDFIGAKSQIINTEYSMLFAKYRILDAMGTLVQTVVGDTGVVYANVGLSADEPVNAKSLPISRSENNDTTLKLKI
jgi:adhesin transport system outer membrane protein